MPQDTSTSTALQQLGLLNKQLAPSFDPLNNFVGQNVQFGMSQERMRMEQANRLQAMQFENQLMQDRARLQAEQQMSLARYTHSASNDQGLKIAQLQAEEAAKHQSAAFAHEDAVRIKTQADAIRSSQEARRVIGDKISKLPDNDDGNRQLVAEYNKAVADPNVLEKMHLETAVGLTKEIKSVLGSMTSGFDTNTPQSRMAIRDFLAAPGVTDLLIKKGKLTSADVAAIAQGGDPSKIKNVIDQVATESAWFGQDRTVLSQLTTAWNQALKDSGAATSPDQLVQADYLKSLLDRRDTEAKSLYNPDSFKALTAAHGMGAQPKSMLPPPPSDGLNTPQNIQPKRFGEINPFQPPADNSNKVGLGRLGTDATTVARYRVPGGASPAYEAAFAPQRYADDPYTELEVRKGILNKRMKDEQFTAGLTQALPFVPNYTPKYDPYKQTQDERILESVVNGLYAPKPPAQMINLNNPLQTPNINIPPDQYPLPPLPQNLNQFLRPQQNPLIPMIPIPRGY